MKYNIGFTLGDPGGDGHACTTDYHIVANHSADEISKAYKETTKLLGFDFIKEVGVDFQSDYWIPEKFTKELLKLGIIDEKYVRESDAEWGAPAGCYEFDYAEEEFVDLYFAIVKYSLPDLEWSIEVIEWANGEGWDICLNDKLISLTYGQLEAIKYLVKTLDYNR